MTSRPTCCLLPTSALLLVLPACHAGAPDSEEGLLRGPCAAERAAGLFEVERGERFTSVSGRVLASPHPAPRPSRWASKGAAGCCAR